jgi:hypothetical protein
MKNVKIIGILLIALGIVFLIYKCNRDPKPSQNVTLDTKDQAKVFVEKNKITVVKRNVDGSTSTTTKFVPKNGTITVGKDGSVDVNIRQFGWSADPGIGAIISSEGLSLSLDLQVMYWKRMGLNVGSGFRSTSSKNANDFVKDAFRPFVGVSYRLPWNIVSNTSVLTGYEPLQKQLCFGIRVQL